MNLVHTCLSFFSWLARTLLTLGNVLSASSSACKKKCPAQLANVRFAGLGGLIFGDVPVPPMAAGRG